jgi:hypothetical protein
MKKVLLAGTALVGALVASPANAELELGLGGHFRAYGVYVDHDDDYGGAVGSDASANLREFDLRRDGEVYFSGEATTDDGLTVGVHHEMNTEDDLSTTDANETYMYVSGGWGRANVGSEDGAAYLLQVAAPSADSNVDGLRTYIEGVGGINSGGWGYDHADFRATDRFTYLTPKFNGFQAGVSYAPEAGQNAIGNNVASMATDNDEEDNEDLWEVAARWDGEFQGFGLSVGGGYSTSDLEADGTAVGEFTEGLDTWNAGLNVAFSGFSVGGAFLRTETEALIAGPANVDIEADTWVVGAAYDNGPYHAGITFLDVEADTDQSGTLAEGDRWTVGGGYTYGPGMTFRGSVSRFNEDLTGLGDSDEDATQVTIGTDVQF